MERLQQGSLDIWELDLNEVRGIEDELCELLKVKVEDCDVKVSEKGGKWSCKGARSA